MFLAPEERNICRNRNQKTICTPLGVLCKNRLIMVHDHVDAVMQHSLNGGAIQTSICITPVINQH
jgi:hypothetical protein